MVLRRGFVLDIQKILLTTINMLTASNICFEIEGRSILSDIDIRIEKEQIVILLGPSGAGKTTLLRCLAMLSMPVSGNLSVDDEHVSFPTKENVSRFWPNITAVFQQHFLWPHLTLRRNIELALGLTKRGHKSTIDELVDVLNLGAFIDHYPHQASLGQRQRAAIARALALHPHYVLLDEITSALDVEQSYAVLQHLLELKRRNIGILLITHHLEFAKALLDADSNNRFCFIDEGRIVETGNASNLMNSRHDRVRSFINKMGYNTSAK